MNSTKQTKDKGVKSTVWEICKFWILQNFVLLNPLVILFERYVNFEFYKTLVVSSMITHKFERYVNFEFYKTSYGDFTERN